MVAPIVAIADALAELGVTAGTADATRVAKINDAISAEIRRLCRRVFEATETTYTAELYRLRGVREFNLLHTPVASITSITETYLDGSSDEPYPTTEYLLENAETGHVRIGIYFGPHAWPKNWALGGPDYIMVTYKATGEVPAPITLAALEWLVDRWSKWGERADLANYQTGGDSEAYFASLAGRPSHNVARALSLYHHSTGGGVV